MSQHTHTHTRPARPLPLTCAVDVFGCVRGTASGPTLRGNDAQSCCRWVQCAGYQKPARPILSVAFFCVGVHRSELSIPNCRERRLRPLRDLGSIGVEKRVRSEVQARATRTKHNQIRQELAKGLSCTTPTCWIPLFALSTCDHAPV